MKPANGLETRIVLSVCSLTGEELFRAIVRHLAQITGAPYAFVSEATGPGELRLVAVWNRGVYEQDVTLDVKGTPCEAVLQDGRSVAHEDLLGRFPDDPRVAALGATRYLAQPIVDNGHVLGHFGVMGGDSTRLDAGFDPLLGVFAARAQAELLRRRREARGSYLSIHDPMTALPNRILFMDRLNQALARSNWHSNLVAVVRVDVERFRAIHDTAGENLASRLMELIALRLRSCVRDGDTVARLGLEEFSLILGDLTSGEDVAPVARNVQAAFRPAFRVGGQEFTVGSAIGIAVYPSDGEDAEALLRSAEAAVRAAHREGPRDYRYYSTALDAQHERQLRLESELARAVEHSEFEVHYQPQVDREHRQLTGLEALVRWRHPELGLIGPTEFISLLEETGLIVEVGEWVLREACRQSRAWRQQGAAMGRISVNLSARQLRDPSLVASIARILEETGVPAGDLELEITEGMVDDGEAAHHACAAIARMGVALAIDDFGTGYASVARLKRMPVSTLKIDQTFVRDVATNADDAALARALIGLAHSLRLRVVAEGVETNEQHAFLEAERCDEFQGFLFGRPLPPQEISCRFNRIH